MNDVIRTDTGHLLVGQTWLLVRDVADASFEAVKAAGSTNPGFDSPPFCYTGCPYGEAILNLGCRPVDAPEQWRTEFVYHDQKKPWRSREPIWPRVFNLDQSLYEQ